MKVYECDSGFELPALVKHMMLSEEELETAGQIPAALLQEALNLGDGALNRPPPNDEVAMARLMGQTKSFFCCLVFDLFCFQEVTHRCQVWKSKLKVFAELPQTMPWRCSCTVCFLGMLRMRLLKKETRPSL
jgi:hypothetical protein